MSENFEMFCTGVGWNDKKKYFNDLWMQHYSYPASWKKRVTVMFCVLGPHFLTQLHDTASLLSHGVLDLVFTQIKTSFIR